MFVYMQLCLNSRTVRF